MDGRGRARRHDRGRVARGLPRIIASQGNRLLRLIDDLLTVGRIEAGRARPRHTAVAVVPALRVLTTANSPDVEVHGPEHLAALVDPGHLDQVVLNLVANAQKYGSRQPTRTP